MHRFTVRTQKRCQLIPIDGPIQDLLEQAGVRSGLCHVYVPHTTAGVTINENADPDVVQDIIEALDRLVPWQAGYAHTEGNSAAHVKSVMVGCTTTIPIDNGRLALGTWQSVFFCEFDGPRTRQVWVSVTGE